MINFWIKIYSGLNQTAIGLFNPLDPLCRTVQLQRCGSESKPPGYCLKRIPNPLFLAIFGYLQIYIG